MRDHITDAEKEVKKSKQNHPGLICGRGKNLEQRKGCKLGTESSNKNGGAGTVVRRRLVSGRGKNLEQRKTSNLGGGSLKDVERGAKTSIGFCNCCGDSGWVVV